MRYLRGARSILLRGWGGSVPIVKLPAALPNIGPIGGGVGSAGALFKLNDEGALNGKRFDVGDGEAGNVLVW